MTNGYMFRQGVNNHPWTIGEWGEPVQKLSNGTIKVVVLLACSFEMFVSFWVN